MVGDPEQLRPDIVEGVCDIGKQHRLFRIKKRQKCHGQHIVGAHAHKYLGRLHMIPLRQRIQKLSRRRIRIQPQTVCVKAPKHFLHPRRRRIRVFIGIQFDHIRFIRLFAGHIRGHFPDIFSPSAHDFSLLFIE